MVAKLPADVLAAFEAAWAGYERTMFAAAVKVAEFGFDRGGLEGPTDRVHTDAKIHVRNTGRILLGMSFPVWSRRPAGAPFIEGRQDAPPDQLEKPWQPWESVLLTDLLICRLTIHTIPYLTMINPDDFQEPA